MTKIGLALAWWTITAVAVWGQITGTVSDAETGEGLFGANVVVRGTNYGAVTDDEGRFRINYTGRPPVTLVATYVGYDSVSVVVNDFSKPVKIVLGVAGVMTEEIKIVDVYISEKLQESPQTVERMDIAAIKSTPSANFYDGLGNLKGVDVTAAAMGFKVINTRGFNSTQPVRVLQLIDRVDNASPGLNFSIGNMVGVSELDVQSVDLIVGASGAMYGPNAFNGVINMQTKDPFIHQGVSLQLKGGERQWFDGAVRYARAFKNKDGEDKFAFKINGAFMRAYDWEATNADPTPRSELQVYGTTNPGGYDAVNRYGDENPDVRSNAYGIRARPGLGTFFRTGYWEKDIVDYNTKSIKLDGQVSYRLTDSLQLDLGMRFGTGTTVLQGDNRYSLKDFVFLQPKLEIKDLRDRFYFLSYLSAEDAGKSYDAVLTAQLLQLRAKTSERWSLDYESYWSTNIQPKITRMPGYTALPPFQSGQPPEYFEEYFRQLNAFVLSIRDSLYLWHEMARRYADGRGISLTARPRLEVGTEEFNRAFREIIARPSGGRPGAVLDPAAIAARGARFVDRSKLFHAQGQYQFKPKFMESIAVGGSFRYYLPVSDGTVFEDTLINAADSSQGFKSLTGIWEAGAFVGAEKKFFDQKLKFNLTVRFDKHVNFQALFSPFASAVYTYNKKHNFRAALSSAFRNPTLQDQYLNYWVSTNVLLRGNLTGADSLVTIQSLFDYYSTSSNAYDTLVFINVPRVRPERVWTAEIGYKGSFWDNRLFFDASYFFNYYQHFIGYIFASTPPDPDPNKYFDRVTYRLPTNAPDAVTTQGFALGFNFFFAKFLSLNGNYSWNKLIAGGRRDDVARSEVRDLSLRNEDIVPAFNTPEHKFNIGFGSREIRTKIGFLNKIWDKLPIMQIKNVGFQVNYKWVQGFVFEGSPQFTGFVPQYDVVDAQITYNVPKWKTSFKAGASNLFNRRYLNVYGGPYIGRLAYFAINVDL